MPILNEQWSSFLGVSVVESPPANAGDMGSIPDLGRSHMARSSWALVPQLLSLCSTASEPRPLKPVNPGAFAVQQEKLLQCEAHASPLESSPAHYNLEKRLLSSQDPAQAKIINE